MGSHVTEESHLHINLLLYCSFLRLFHLSLLLNMQRPLNEIKINHVYCLLLCLTSSPRPLVVLFAVKVIRSQRSIQVYFCNKSSAFGSAPPLSVGLLSIFISAYDRPIRSICFCLKKRFRIISFNAKQVVCYNLHFRISHIKSDRDNCNFIKHSLFIGATIT